MAAEALHRKSTRVEWAEVPSTAATGLNARPALINTVISAAMASMEKRAVVVGGVNPKTGKCVSQSLEYDLVTKQWSNLGNWFPVALSDAAMVTCGSSYVLFGGFNDETVNNDLWIATQKTDESGAVHMGSWKRVSAAGPGPCARRCHAMVTSPVAKEDGSFSVYLFGGFDGAHRLNDLWTISISGTDGQVTSSWALLPSDGMVPSPRDACAFAFDTANQRLIVFGGFHNALDRDVYYYDLGTSKWSKPNFALGPSKRQGSFGVYHHQYFVTLFGHDGKNTLSQACQLGLSDGRWSLLSFDGDEMEPRQYAAFCMAEGGKKALVFGGQSKGKYLSSVLELEFEKCDAAVAATKGKK